VLAHRDELTAQNRAKFAAGGAGRVHLRRRRQEKSWAVRSPSPWRRRWRDHGQSQSDAALDLLVIDEAHHAVADSYRRIIDRVRDANPDCRIFGVTATPNRGDRKGLREVFDNVADQVRLGELIASGHLVPPRTFVIDVGVQDELRAVRKTACGFRHGRGGGHHEPRAVTDEVIRHWREKAGDRQTVVFCSTVGHARTSCDRGFVEAGVPPP
jgi:DNA repair protein RadD